MRFLRVLCLFVFLANVAGVARAQVPSTMSYQGVLTDAEGLAVADGTYTLTFAVYEEEGAEAATWKETLDVVVSAGVFSAILGKTESLDGVFSGARWLGISVGEDAELSPRLELSAVPFSQVSQGVLGATNVFPGDGSVGIGTGGSESPGETMAKLDVVGDLRVTDVPPSAISDIEAIRILVHDAESGHVEYINTTSLGALGLVGPAGPIGPIGPAGPRGPAGIALLINIPFVIVNAAGDTTTVIYPDGTSFHAGLETFEKGIVSRNQAGEEVYVGPFADGRVGVSIADADGHVWSGMDHDGFSSWLDRDMTKSVRVGVDGISIWDEANQKYLYQVNADGSSYHAGLETFAGGIEVPGSNGDKIRISEAADGLMEIGFTDPDGHKWTNLNHRGLQTWLDAEMTRRFVVQNDGIGIFDDDAGVWVTRHNPDGSISFNGNDGEDWTAINHDGVSSWLDAAMTKRAIFGGNGSGVGIWDETDEKWLWHVAADGTSSHAALETFSGGIALADGTILNGAGDLGSGGTSFNGTLTNQPLVLIDADGNEVFRVNEDGTSSHAGLETFSGGIAIGEGAAITLSDGTTIAGSGDLGGGTTAFNGVLNNMPLVVSDGDGKEVFRVDTDGTSTHTGVETFEQGAIMGTGDDLMTVGGTGLFAFGENGAEFLLNQDGLTMSGYIRVMDANDPLKEVYRVNQDGTSTHSGLETFSGGIAIGEGAAITLADGTVIDDAADFASTPFDGTLTNQPLIVKDASGNEVFRVDTDGTSTHTGVETFEQGAIMGTGDNLMTVGGTGLFAFGENGAEFLLDQDGLTMSGFIRVMDANDPLKEVYRVNQDGTSTHSGLETFSGGIAIGEGAAITLADGTVIDDAADFASTPFDGTLTNQPLVLKDASGNEVFRVDTDGKSTQAGLGTFNGGATVNGQMNVFGADPATCIFCLDPFADPTSGYALMLRGNLDMMSGGIYASFIQANSKQFRIDHPLDSENKWLRHASIESDKMTNLYDGNVVLDADGKATIHLPEWFEALNEDFRYQLTAIGGPGAGLYIASEVENGQFSIAGGAQGLKVSWQVTGTRHDTWAVDNPLQIESAKTNSER